MELEVSFLAKHEEIMAKATAYIKANLDRPFSVPELAAEIGISNRLLLMVFRKMLNQTVVDFIRMEKIAKAMALLRQTKLSITTIALESGFEDYAHFAKTFRKKVGATPMEFRKRVQQLGEASIEAGPLSLEKKEEWFKDSFRAKNLGPYWRPVSGDWRQDQAGLVGMAPTSTIAFVKPLPENCRISFQIKTQVHAQWSGPSITLRLMDERESLSYCEFTIATGDRAAGHLTHYRTGHLWNQNARIREDEWHRASLEIKEETLLFSVDGKEMFRFRDSFPPSYSSRCYLHIGNWHCDARVRAFTVHNLGFMPAIRPIRQGDVLYNAGMAGKAMEFYLRYLQAGSVTDEETMELRYKIGMCCLRTGALAQAGGWMDKVVSLRENRFWAQQARLSLLDLYRKPADMDSLLEHLRHCYADAETKGQAQVSLLATVRDFWERGFYPEADRIMETWINLESPNTFVHQMAQYYQSENFLKMRRVEKAENMLRCLAANSRIHEIILLARINLMQLYHEGGKVRESERLRIDIETTEADAEARARCMVQQALNLRAKHRFEEALRILEEIPKQHGASETGFLCHLKIQAGFILCCMDRLAQGRKALEEANAILSGAAGNLHYLPFYLVEKNYPVSAKSLLADYRSSKGLASVWAELGIKAGILHELAGMEAEAKSIFKEVSLRFPNEQIRFFGPMAHALFVGEDFDFTELPYEAHRRSEIFYLLGLLQEKRGERDAARKFFELSVKEDPALRWPAVFAAKKFGASVS